MMENGFGGRLGLKPWWKSSLVLLKSDWAIVIILFGLPPGKVSMKVHILRRLLGRKGVRLSGGD
jgi:hypothetical protein